MFWADVDTRGTGDLWYRLSTDSLLFDRANTEIRTAFPYQPPFNATQMYIATWDGVGYFDSKVDRVCYIPELYVYPEYCSVCNEKILMYGRT